MISNLNKISFKDNHNLKWILTFVFFTLVSYVLLFSTNLYLIIICSSIFLFKLVRLVNNLIILSKKNKEEKGESIFHEPNSFGRVKKVSIFTLLVLIVAAIAIVCFRLFSSNVLP